MERKDNNTLSKSQIHRRFWFLINLTFNPGTGTLLPSFHSTNRQLKPESKDTITEHPLPRFTLMQLAAEISEKIK